VEIAFTPASLTAKLVAMELLQSFIEVYDLALSHPFALAASARVEGKALASMVLGR
jgi:hypothetical protein